ncbi:MAG: 50S ribosomal protein L9 [Actinobacteria bacterium]|nr:50S ribosomal protein L9 [Actinomycetota bacterium]
MKVILKEAVGGLGKVGDVVDVADGYAQNYLIPRGMAVMATPGTLKDWAQRKAALAKKEAQEREEAQALADRLKDKEVKIEARVGDGGRLYGSVTSREIAAAIKAQLKIKVDRKKIELPDSIKELGIYPVTIKVYPGVDATVNVNVVKSREEK